MSKPDETRSQGDPEQRGDAGDAVAEPDGDAKARFTPTSGGGQADQMPSEYGARGTNASGNAEEGKV